MYDEKEYNFANACLKICLIISIRLSKRNIGFYFILHLMYEKRNLIGMSVNHYLSIKMVKLVFFGGAGITSSVAVTRTHAKYRKRIKTIQ